MVNGGTFGGTGTVDDTLTINGGIHAPGLSPGVMTVNSNYTLNAAGTLQMEILGTTPGTQYDQLKVTGASSLVTLAGDAGGRHHQHSWPSAPRSASSPTPAAWR